MVSHREDLDTGDMALRCNTVLAATHWEPTASPSSQQLPTVALRAWSQVDLFLSACSLHIRTVMGFLPAHISEN